MMWLLFISNQHTKIDIASLNAVHADATFISQLTHKKYFISTAHRSQSTHHHSTGFDGLIFKLCYCFDFYNFQTSSMNSIQHAFCPKTELEYEPQKWCKRLGSKCITCNTSLTHQKCVSLCRCYYFCHQNCFISTFEPQLTDEQADIRCNQCDEILKLNLEANYNYSPSRSMMKLIKIGVTTLLLVLILLGIVLTINSTLKSDLSLLLLYLQGLILSLLLYLLVIYVRDWLYIKVVKITELVSTKLEIQTSAFKEIDIRTSEELTKDELLFESKKDKQ